MSRESLLRAILESPEDDTPRLVYSDWLEEYGDERDRLRAEFIRVQVALAIQRDPNRRPPASPDNDLLQDKLSKLEYKLLWPARKFQMESVPDSMILETGMFLPHDSYIGSVSRGFVCCVQAHAITLRSNIIPMFMGQPIHQVSLIGVHPANVRRRSGGRMCYAWFKESVGRPARGPQSGTSVLPSELFPKDRNRVNFKSSREARDWLSTACVAWGRREAGLPEWPAVI